MPELSTRQIPVHLEGGAMVVIRAEVLGMEDEDADIEHDVAGGVTEIDSVLNGIRTFATQLGSLFDQSGADKVSVEFGCEMGVESGTLVAIIGKVGAKSTMNVTLEWSRRV